MNINICLRLAWKLVLRDGRSGELGILALALLIAVAGTTAVSLFGHRLTRTMERQAAEFLAADLLVSAHEPPPPVWFDKAQALGLRTAAAVEFASVLVEHDEMLLTGAKAVSGGYPLRGAVRSTLTDVAAETTTPAAPAPGTAWVDQRVLASLKLALGDSVTVGDQRLTLTRVITHEPDRRGDLFSLSPRLLFNSADLPAANVLGPGSNAHYYAQFAGDEPTVRTFKQWLKPQLRPGQRLVDIHEDRPELGNALARAERYLGLSSTVIVLIAGVAIAMSARRYSERHYDLTALLKCLGARERDVVLIHAVQYLLIGSVASLLGCGVGYLAQAGVAAWLKGLLPHELVAPAWYAPLFGWAAGLFVLLGFALPPVLRLKRLPPLRVLRRDLAPLPSSAWTVYGLALATLAALIWRYTGDGRMTAIVLGIALGVLAVASGLVLALLQAARGLLPLLSLPWRLGLQNLTRQPRLGLTQILAFGLTMTAMLVSLLVRTELLHEWQRQLPANAPNYFALNLFAADLADFQAFSAQQQITPNALYPVVRGRLTAINGVDVQTRVHKDSAAEGATNRELSLTWSQQPPADNQITQGEWWGGNPAPGLVSVEEKLADSLNLRLGDSLTFNIGGQVRNGTVVSFRALRWDSLRPNFYMVFSPGSLDDFPATWLTSFYVPADHKAGLVALAKRFPAMTLLEIEQLLKQVQDILKQITLAIEFVLLFALAAGFAVLFAAVRTTLDGRLREDALLRAMGASGWLLRKSLALEFTALGLLSGLLAAAASDAIAWALFTRVFGLQPRLHWEFWLWTPALGAVSIGLIGYLHTRQIVRVSPLQVLREV